MSVLKLPYLRRTDDIDKAPLLALAVAGHSFLSADLRDDPGAPPLYSTRTSNMTTSLLRATTTVAEIKWPSTPMPKSKGKKAPDGVHLQLPNADWIPANSFLKPSTSMDRPRKFRLPHYSHNMKWQKRASGYWCTTSTVKGPIAIYEPPTGDLPGRLVVYETLQDEHDISPMLAHRTVSILLLDYLLITCVLLVTDSHECMAQTSGQGSLSDLNSDTSFVWKRIAQGQYLYQSPPPLTAQDSTPADYDNKSATLMLQGEVTGITTDGPLNPPIQQASTSHFSFSSESDSGSESRMIVDTPPAKKPAARTGSVIYSSPFSSYTCIDSSLSTDAPPHSANERQKFPSSLVATHTSRRLQSSDGLSLEESDLASGLDSSTASPSSDPSLPQRSPVPSLSRSRSISRPLPRTPASPMVEPRSLITHRSHSRIRIDQRSVEKPWSPAAVPPLPSMGVGSPTTIPNQGRSLPPTPFDLAANRSPSGMVAPVRAMTTGVDGYSGAQLVRKDFGSDYEPSGRSSDSLLGRVQIDQNRPSPTRPSFDHPPPAYSTIDFHAPDPGWKPES